MAFPTIELGTMLGTSDCTTAAGGGGGNGGGTTWCGGEYGGGMWLLRMSGSLSDGPQWDPAGAVSVEVAV